MATQEIKVEAAQVAPNLPTMGFDVSRFARVHVQASQLANVTDYDLQHYALVDDEMVDGNGQPTGSSSFPAGVWPEMDTLARTKTAGFHITIPLDGKQRWAPRVTNITTGGSPVIILTLRFESA